MHRILNETHKNSNIRILKARDALFDKARVLNNRYRAACLRLPIVISIIGLLTIGASHLFPQIAFLAEVGSYLEDNLEIIVGITALTAFCVDCILAKHIGDFLVRSNRLRELYDCKVLGLEENPFFYCGIQETVEDDIQYADQRLDKPKYEVWYCEIFSDDDFRNAICLMMDNVIYTYYIYAANRKRHFIKLLLYALVFAAYSIWYIAASESVRTALINPIILFAAVFDNIKDLVSNYITSKELENTNRELKDTVMRQSEEIKNIVDPERKKQLLRSLEDVIIRNRDNSLFVPKSIRDKYLANGNPFYVELDRVKNLFWEGTILFKPVLPADYEVPDTEDETRTVTLDTVHEELLKMLRDVQKALDEAGVRFMLDGGTLIGSIREQHHGFLPWDDDVDLSLKNSDVDRAIKAIREKLGEQYEIQDCATERFYSPRLSRLRVRQKNAVSRIDEKDSAMYELYQSRGLFLDIYSYGPILVNKVVDAAFRKVAFYGIHKRIQATETKWKYNAPSSEKKKRYQRAFLRQKREFLRRRAWYLKNAKCKKYYSYIPGYIENIKKAGPYIAGTHLYGEKNTAIFERSEFEVPTKPEEVLAAFYGKRWDESPYRTLDSLKGYRFSEDTFDSSCYKHIKGITLFHHSEEDVTDEPTA